MSTQDRVIELRSKDSLLSLRGIAERVGISRQRAHQILSSRGMSPTGRIRLTCHRCGKRFTRKRTDVRKNKGQRRFFCSRECATEANLRGRERVYDHGQILRLAEEGYRPKQISRLVGVSPMQAWRIVRAGRSGKSQSF